MPRFFIDASQISDNAVIITGNDAYHISYSLRMRVGEKILVCDNNLIEYQCEITNFTKEKVEAKILSSKKSENEPPYDAVIYQAVVKGDKFDTVVQKVIETGAKRIVPFISSRCIVKLDDKSKANKLERWNKIAKDASEQCGRACKIEVGRVLTYDEMLLDALKADLPIICYESENKTSIKRVIRSKDFKSVSIIIGPEGGFSEEEVKSAVSKGINCCTLGNRILRTETAATYALSCLSYEFELSK